MTTDRQTSVTPNTSADNARNRPARLPRRQRVVSAIASAVISGVLLGGLVYGMTNTPDALVAMAGAATAATRA